MLYTATVFSITMYTTNNTYKISENLVHQIFANLTSVVCSLGPEQNLYAFILGEDNSTDLG